VVAGNVEVVGAVDTVGRCATSCARLGWGRHHVALIATEQTRKEHRIVGGLYWSTHLEAMEEAHAGRHGCHELAHPPGDEGEED